MGPRGSSSGDGQERGVASPQPLRRRPAFALCPQRADRSSARAAGSAPAPSRHPRTRSRCMRAGNVSWWRSERILGEAPSEQPEIASRIGPELTFDPLEMPGTTPATVSGRLSGQACRLKRCIQANRASASSSALVRLRQCACATCLGPNASISQLLPQELGQYRLECASRQRSYFLADKLAASSKI